MLFLLFQLGNDRYALEASRVVEVVPLLSLKQIPTVHSPQSTVHSPGLRTQMFVYRGRAIPALDLCELTLGRPARERLSTRIIIINAGEGEVTSDKWQVTGSGSPVSPGTCHLAPVTGLLGLIAERVTEMMRRDLRDFQEVSGAQSQVSGKLTPDLSHLAPWLGPVLMDDRGIIQLLHAHPRTLSGFAEKMRDLVFANESD